MKVEKLFKEKKYYIPIILFVMFLWGSAFPVLKLSYKEFAINNADYFIKIYFAGIRFFISGLFVFLYVRLFVKEVIDFKKLDYKFLVVLSLLQITLQYIFYYIGVSNTTGIKSAILQSSGTFIIVILSSFVFKDDKLNKYKIFAVLIGLVGIAVTNITSGFDFSFKLQGEGFLFIAALFSSLGHIYMKSKGSRTNAVVATCFQFIIGSILLIIIGRIGMFSKLTWTFNGVLLLLYSGFLSATAFTLWYMVLKYNKAGEVSVYMLFIPIFGTILSSIFLPDEKFTINILIGLILVIFGIAVLNMRQTSKKIK